MNDDYKELVDFLGQKFDKIDEQFSDIEKTAKEFRDDMLSFKDQALKDLGDLKQEKTVGDDQGKRLKKVLEIHNTALKSNKIISKQQASEIDGLRVF